MHFVTEGDKHEQRAHNKQTQHDANIRNVKSDTVWQVRTQSRGHPMREHADPLPPLVTLLVTLRPRAHVQWGRVCELSRRPSPKREETVDCKVVHLSLEQVKEDNVGREDDQERAYRRLHNIGQNEVSRLKGLINGVRGVGA